MQTGRKQEEKEPGDAVIGGDLEILIVDELRFGAGGVQGFGPETAAVEVGGAAAGAGQRGFGELGPACFPDLEQTQLAALFENGMIEGTGDRNGGGGEEDREDEGGDGTPAEGGPAGALGEPLPDEDAAGESERGETGPESEHSHPAPGSEDGEDRSRAQRGRPETRGTGTPSEERDGDPERHQHRKEGREVIGMIEKASDPVGVGAVVTRKDPEGGVDGRLENREAEVQGHEQREQIDEAVARPGGEEEDEAKPVDEEGTNDEGGILTGEISDRSGRRPRQKVSEKDDKAAGAKQRNPERDPLEKQSDRKRPGEADHPVSRPDEGHRHGSAHQSRQEQPDEKDRQHQLAPCFLHSNVVPSGDRMNYAAF